MAPTSYIEMRVLSGAGGELRRPAPPGALLQLYAATLGLPVFVGSSGVFRGTSFDLVTVVPVSLFVGAALVLSEFLVRGKRGLNAAAEVPVTLITLLSLAVYCAFEAFRRAPVAPQVWAVYFAPAFVGVFAGAACDRRWTAAALLERFALTLAVVATTHVVYSFARLGVVGALAQRGTDDVLGLFSVYQKFIYYPLVIMLANIYLVLFARKSALHWAAIAGLGTASLMTAAREPFVVLAAALLIFVAWLRRPRHLLIAALTAACVGLAILRYQEALSGMALFAKFTQFASSDPEQRTGGRLHEIALQLGQVRDHLILGDSFVLRPGFERSPHNQYVDLLRRGGVVFLALMVGFVVAAARAAVRLTRSDPLFRYVAIALVCVLGVSFNVNTPMRAPYSSLVVWTFVGLALSRGAREGRAAPQIAGSSGLTPGQVTPSRA